MNVGQCYRLAAVCSYQDCMTLNGLFILQLTSLITKVTSHSVTNLEQIRLDVLPHMLRSLGAVFKSITIKENYL
jgi:hypothetical protein